MSVGTVWYFIGSCTWYVPLMVKYPSHVALSNIMLEQNEVERDNVDCHILGRHIPEIPLFGVNMAQGGTIKCHGIMK